MEYNERERIKFILADLSSISGIFVNDVKNTDLPKFRRLEDFSNKVIQINKTGWRYPVDVSLVWEGGKNVLYISVKLNFLYFNPTDAFKEFINRNVEDSRKQHAMQAFQHWENGGDEYKNIFRGQSVKVVVSLSETNSAFDAVKVFLDMPGDYSVGWGGVGLIDSKAYTEKVLFLSDANNPEGTSMHEFGHILGLGDAYKSQYIPGLYWGDGVDYDTYPDAAGTIMDRGHMPTSNDVEMVINAFYTGKRQNFQSECFWHSVSPVSRK
ncbi:MAG: hypothetical protein LBS36_04650 [Oscillospiraceae bacterium]|jgi:hypothetical protein|nr:hypothetical protein [Oscillospiraceae bacterium]